MTGDATETTAKVNIHGIAERGAAPLANPDAPAGANGNTCRGAFPSGEFVAKQRDVDGLCAIAPTHLDASTIGLPAKFTRLISAQKIRPFSLNIATSADQCLKN